MLDSNMLIWLFNETKKVYLYVSNFLAVDLQKNNLQLKP
jgi:hypothetical protein